jgi:putative Mg2+ transporter-C (MgtC) family protein
MSFIEWLASLHAGLLGRIALGTALGAAIGLERDLHGRPAGLRTHTIVALASATFMVVSTDFVNYQHYAPGGLVEVDASRIAASVVSGIGFLGAGAILRTGFTVRGLTTAATLWLVAAIGMAAGGGMYSVAVFVTAIGIASLTALRRFEDRGEPIARQRLTVSLESGTAAVPEISAALERAGAKVFEQDLERDEGRLRVTFEVRSPRLLANHELARLVEGVPGVTHLRIERV